MTRGNNRGLIFGDDSDYQKMLRLLGETNTKLTAVSRRFDSGKTRLKESREMQKFVKQIRKLVAKVELED